MLDLMEPFHNFLVDGIDAFAEATWAFIKGAFSAGAMTEEWWATVVGGEITINVGDESTTTDHPGMLNVVALAMIPLLVSLVALQVIVSVLRSSTAGLLRALAVGVFAIPSIYVLAGMTWLILAGFDDLTQGILSVGTDGNEDAVSDVVALFGMTVNSQTGEIMLDENYQYWEMMHDDENLGKIILSWVVAGVLFLCGLGLALMMIFRTVVIIVLVIFMPVAIYGLASEAAKAMFSRWASLVVALIISKPAAAVIVKTGLTMASVGDDWIQLVSGIVLLLIAALAPILTLAFISFMTGGSSDSLERAAIGAGMSGYAAAGSARRAATGGARTAGRAAKSVGRTGANVVRSSSSGGGRKRSQTPSSPGQQSGPGKGPGGGGQSGRHSSGDQRSRQSNQQANESSDRASHRGDES